MRNTRFGSVTRGAALGAALLALGAIPAAGPLDGAASGVAFAPGVETAVAQEAGPGDETTVVVRAVAHDAKVIGSGVGGVRITIRNAETGEVLARGLQEGGTGSTERIMRKPHPRAGTVYGTEDAAAYEAVLSLDSPTRVEIVAEGPLGTPHATQRASRTMLLVPGRDVTGEGVVLELYGFTVEMQRPSDDATPVAGQSMPVRASVTMLCGCPIEPGGLWDADRIDVTARLVRDGRVVRESEMSFAGETNIFEGTITPPADGGYELVILASDAERANFGQVRTEVSVREE
ncbi:MAG: hypothetical protein Q8W44_04535 [Candidatus Palauibacterales bacterium]|nr:hypothetical protein [Candidatus Palauibacterales bacterium]